jgi:hypothetical protein
MSHGYLEECDAITLHQRANGRQTGRLSAVTARAAGERYNFGLALRPGVT